MAGYIALQTSYAAVHYICNLKQVTHPEPLNDHDYIKYSLGLI